MPAGHPLPPSPQDDEREILQKLTNLREHFQVMEQIDRETRALVERLTQTVGISSSARARASLEIADSINWIDTLLIHRQQRQVATHTRLADTIASTHTAMDGLKQSVKRMESRLAQAVADIDDPTPINQVNAERIMVTIRAVPNAVTALAIQHFLAGIAGVTGVTAKQFTNGQLRFAIQFTPGLARLDLETASAGALESVEEPALPQTYRLASVSRFTKQR